MVIDTGDFSLTGDSDVRSLANDWLKLISFSGASSFANYVALCHPITDGSTNQWQDYVVRVFLFQAPFCLAFSAWVPRGLNCGSMHDLC